MGRPTNWSIHLTNVCVLLGSAEEVVYSEPALDCNADPNDGGNLLNPDAPELCEESNVAENCNGFSDDDDVTLDPLTAGVTTFYEDLDVDGFGDPNSTLSQCDVPVQYVAERVEGFDCSILDESSYPGATSSVTALTTIAMTGWMTTSTVVVLDADDGFGDLNTPSELTCSDPSTETDVYVLNSTDCDDQIMGLI